MEQNSPRCINRDAYGFEVKKDFQTLHAKYAQIWTNEEKERIVIWEFFLNNYCSKDISLRDSNLKPNLDTLDLYKISEDAACLQQFKRLVQSGIPTSLRGELWKKFLLDGNEKQTSQTYGDLVILALNKQSAAVVTQNGWLVQIEKDLSRTFPGHPAMDENGKNALKRVLAAYATRNPAVGYCQGMNFIAGCLLLFMEEEDAFWCLTAIVEDVLPGYFDVNMAASQVDQLVFKHLLEKQFPKLKLHMDQLGVDPTSITTQWFLGIYVTSLPLETCLRVWDVFLFEKCSSLLYRVALALIDFYSKALLDVKDSLEAFLLLQNMAPLSFDSSRLVDVACIAYSHINDRCMIKLRALYQGTVGAYIQERLIQKNKQSSIRDWEFISLEWNASDSSLFSKSARAAATAYKIASSSNPSSTGEVEEILEPLDESYEYPFESIIEDWNNGCKKLKELHVKNQAIVLKLILDYLQGECLTLITNTGNLEAMTKSCEVRVQELQEELDNLTKTLSIKWKDVHKLDDKIQRETFLLDDAYIRKSKILMSLSKAEAQRNLKASFLQDKIELISTLEEGIEKTSVPAHPPLNFLHKLKKLSFKS